jgi:hypothetical protein
VGFGHWREILSARRAWQGYPPSCARLVAANGLLHPIVIDDQKQLIDGRNRLAACKIAQVEPRFEELNGRDPRAYIVSANLNRRNLTKGQQAMALALIYPDERGAGQALGPIDENIHK